MIKQFMSVDMQMIFDIRDEKDNITIYKINYKQN